MSEVLQTIGRSVMEYPYTFGAFAAMSSILTAIMVYVHKGGSQWRQEARDMLTHAVYIHRENPAEAYRMLLKLRNRPGVSRTEVEALMDSTQKSLDEKIRAEVGSAAPLEAASPTYRAFKQVVSDPTVVNLKVL